MGGAPRPSHGAEPRASADGAAVPANAPRPSIVIVIWPNALRNSMVCSACLFALLITALSISNVLIGCAALSVSL